jgi:hypothetical protein
MYTAATSILESDQKWKINALHEAILALLMIKRYSQYTQLSERSEVYFRSLAVKNKNVK